MIEAQDLGRVISPGAGAHLPLEALQHEALALLLLLQGVDGVPCQRRVPGLALHSARRS